MQSPQPPIWHRLSGPVRVWILTGVIAAAAAATAIAVSGYHPLDAPFQIHWLAWVPLVFAAEVAVVSLQFRKDAHVFSMSEVPLVVGLFFVNPVGLIAAQMLGNAAALILYRRQPPLKAAFNLAMLTLQAGLAVVVFRAILRPGDPLGTTGWVAALVAIAVVAASASMLVNMAIALTGGDVSSRERLSALALLAVSSTMNASLGLVAVTVIWTRPGTAWAAVVPPLALYLAYRAYLGQRRERQRVEGLYEATRALHESTEIEAAMLAAVRHAKEMFDAEHAELRVLVDGSDGLCAIAGDNYTRLVRDADAPDDAVTDVLATGHPLLTGCSTEQHARSDHRMIVPVHGPGHINGVLAVSEPLGDTRTFTTRDLQVLETLANQVSVSLENERLEDSVEHLIEAKDSLRLQTLHDPLTGLANRTLLWERLAETLEMRHGRSKQSAVLMLDVDDFKVVNDTYGHIAGDRLLVAVARRLEACCRPEDTVARLGGDEFAILLDRMSTPEDATRVAARISVALTEPVTIGGLDITVQASMGIALVDHGSTPEELIRHADQAMYAAKNTRKGTYQLFEEGNEQRWMQTSILRSELQQAIEQDELTLHYQPVVNLDTGEIIGLEALVRWRHPDRGLLYPDAFIPTAEDTGQIIAIDRWVLQTACTQMQRWHTQIAGPKPSISVNVSPRELPEPDFVNTVQTALTESGLEAKHLILEITENVIAQPYIQILNDLKTLGIRIAIDDFGTGYSSLSYLDRLPIDIVKIDRSFIRATQELSPLVRIILQIGETLRLDIVAEGIETPDELQRLRQLGCRIGQGYHFARPADTDTTTALLTAQPLPAVLAAAR